MNKLPTIPTLEVRNRLIANSRRARLELEEAGLDLDEAIAKLDELIRQQKRERIIKHKQTESNNQ